MEQSQDITHVNPVTTEAGLFDQDKQTLSATGLDVAYDANDNVISLKIPATGIFDRKSIVMNIKKLLDDENITDKSKHMIRNSVMSCFKINPEDLIKPTTDEFIEKLSDKLDESEMKVREMGFDPHKDWKENISELSANQILTKKQQDLAVNSKTPSSEKDDNFSLALKNLYNKEEEDSLYDSLNEEFEQQSEPGNNDNVLKEHKEKEKDKPSIPSQEDSPKSSDTMNDDEIESERESEDPE